MSRNIRILTKPNDGDKYVKIKLEHSFDFLEILSLRLSQADVYRKFAADYGVVVGRVIANGGFGVPNAKVSIFIPLDPNETNPLIKELYPYQKTNDVNSNGIRYNLLEDLPQRSCHNPVGTFPNKRKVLDNDVWLEIYDKYYKFTTSTNFAGDFMIFGVPTGNQNMHMDVDLSNIDYISLKPYDLIEQGYTETLFESKTTFKSGTDLGSLVQIQSKDSAVNVLPFWGDLEENEVGINRIDFNLNTEIIPNATFFGSIFTDSNKSFLRRLCEPIETLGKNCDLAAGTGRIEMIRRVSTTSKEVEYMQIESKQIDENGNWAFTVPMNLNRKVTDEVGNLIDSEDPNIGLPTTALVRFRMSLNENRDDLLRRNAHYLIPNMYNNYQFGNDTEDFDFFEMRWKKTYTVTNYIPRYQKAEGSATLLHTGIKDIGECENTLSFPFNRLKLNPTFFFTILCIIISFIALILDLINKLVGFIVFEVVLAFVCFIKHPFSSDRRSACRCNACYKLNGGLQTPPAPTIPTAWIPSCPDCVECALCYNADDDNSSSSTSYSFKPQSIATLYPPTIIITVDGSGNLGLNQDVIISASDFSSVSPSPTISGYQFRLKTDGSGNLSKVYIINQTGLATNGLLNYSTSYTFVATSTSFSSVAFWGSATSIEFTLDPNEIIILNDLQDSTAGLYSLDDTEYTVVTNGQDVIFETTIGADGELAYISILNINVGQGYTFFDEAFLPLESFTLPNSIIGGTDKIIAFNKEAFQTTQTVGLITVDCSNFDIDDCGGNCQTCPVSVIPLECLGNTYANAIEWGDCLKEALAEELGLVKYFFYNDWVIGSLYSILFNYKSRFRKKGKSVERYCDYNCRAPNVDIFTFAPTFPPEKDPNFKRRRNRCYNAYIGESYIFNAPYLRSTCNESPNLWFRPITSLPATPIESPDGNNYGRGLILEYDGLLYYAARHDIGINTVNDSNLAANNLTVLEKYNLLFATNLIELGSMVSCDKDGEPFVINTLESTTYRRDNGVGVLYDYSDCFTSCPINRYGTQLMSQAGVDIAFAQISDNPNLVGDDGEIYVLQGSASDIPDYDQNNGIIIFDRNNVTLRRLLCENFNYYNVPRTYSSSEVPTDYPLAPPPAYLEELTIDIPPPPVVNDILEFTIDSCAGFDDAEIPADKMPPYYMYFGIRQGQSSLEKLRKNYLDRCID